MLNLKPTLMELREAVASNGVIDLTDEELQEMAALCARELQYRLPLDAVRQGDLSEDCEDAARARRILVSQIVDAEIYPPASNE